MPVIAEAAPVKQKVRRWVWLLVAGLVLVPVLCAAFLPMIWPNVYVGEWAHRGPYMGEEPWNASGWDDLDFGSYLGVTTYSQNGQKVTNDSGGRLEVIWKPVSRHRIRLFGNSWLASVRCEEVWHVRPFGMCAVVETTIDGWSAIRPAKYHRIIHPLSDWFPFLNR